jgi:hypothetical protein
MERRDEACRNCGAARVGPYCAQCGQEFADHDHSLGHLVHDLVHGLGHLDVGILRDLRPLLFAPGFLTREHLDGRRVRHLRPLQVFLVVNLLFFLVGPSFGLFRYRLEPDAHGRFFAGDPREALAAAKMARARETPAQFAARFEEHEAHWRKGLVLLMVPPFAFVVWALQRRRSPYYLDHLAFALHFYSFFLVALIAVGGVAIALVLAAARLRGGHGGSVGDAVLVPALLAVCWLYLVLALRRAYDVGVPAAIGQGLALTGTALLLTPLYAMAVMTATLLAM